MGHAIETHIFDVKTNKIEEQKNRNSIETRLNGVSEYHSDNRNGLYSSIRFLDNKIYENDIKAETAIKTLDKGWYDQLAVQFYDYEARPDTKTILNLKEQLQKRRVELAEYKQANSVRNRKSQYVGCTKCGSKVNKDYFPKGENYINRCPLCNTDLSSDTVKKTIESKTQKINELDTSIETKVRENNSKGKKQLKWMVKIEYHV